MRANFGQRAFAYAEGREQRAAADECHDAIQEMKDGFGALPFNMAASSSSSSASDSDSDASLHSASSEPAVDRRAERGEMQGGGSPSAPPCRTPGMPKSLKGGCCGSVRCCSYVRISREGGGRYYQQGVMYLYKYMYFFNHEHDKQHCMFWFRIVV